MRIKSVLNPNQLHRVVRDYRTHFTEPEQKFLVNMLVACDLNQEISEKQWAWLSALIRKVEILAQMEREYNEDPEEFKLKTDYYKNNGTPGEFLKNRR